MNKETEIAIIRHRSGFDNVADDFSIAEAGEAEVVDETRESLAVYRIPDGFELHADAHGVPTLWKREGATLHRTELAPHSSGRPQLILGGGFGPVLDFIRYA